MRLIDQQGSGCGEHDRRALPLIAPRAAPLRHLHPAVAVPARNEERRIPSLLAALDRQSWCRTADRRLPVVLVLNNCTDRSRDAALDAAARCPRLAVDIHEVVLPPPAAHVGTARRLALDRAREACPQDDAVLLTTDADAVPDENWVDANLAAIKAGADLVGGLLIGDPAEEARLGPGFAARAAAIAAYATLCDRYAALVDPVRCDPWPRHRNHTGGSLAVRAETYGAVGGMPALPRREDVAFVTRVCAAGGRLVHPLDVRVMVSARLSGRAEGGMADCLKEWMRLETEGAPVLVDDPLAWRAHLRRRRAVRELAHLPEAERPAMAASLGLQAPTLAGDDPEALGTALVALHAPEDLDMAATVPILSATAALEEMVRDVKGTDLAA